MLTKFISYQYFSPYVVADLRRMATAFNTTVPSLENELTALILDGFIDARIDSHNKVCWIILILYHQIRFSLLIELSLLSKILHARDIDHRTSAFEKAFMVGKEYQRRMKVKCTYTCLISRHNYDHLFPIDFFDIIFITLQALILRSIVLKNKIIVKVFPKMWFKTKN